MGGFGSGRSSHRITVSCFRQLDIRRLHRDGLLAPGMLYMWQWTRDGKRTAGIAIATAEYYLTLDYVITRENGERVKKEYPVSLAWTACHLGGRRPWFLCPECGRRVAVLYGGEVFTCRHCRDLAYDSQREDLMSRAMRRGQKIENRLGWNGRRNKGKPKGMHWRTFERLDQERDRFNTISLMAMAHRFNLLAGDDPRRVGGSKL